MNNSLKAVTLALLLLPALAYALPAATAATAASTDGRAAAEHASALNCAGEARVRRPAPQAGAEPYAEQDGAFRDITMDGKIFRR